MIIEPDFLDHWKTRLLMRLLETEAAPNYVIRLWSHCQTRKTNRFHEWTPDLLASVCRWPGNSDQFWQAMMQTFCRYQDGHLIVHQWDEVNASLIAAWGNGGKGGRPKKPTGNPWVNPDSIPVNPRANPESIPVNPRITHGVTDRVDREDKTEKTEAPKSPRERFVKPTCDEVEAQCIHIGLPVAEALKFINYYESKGWVVGKTGMKSWKASLAGWKQRRDENSATAPTVIKELDWRHSV